MECVSDMEGTSDDRGGVVMLFAKKNCSLGGDPRGKFAQSAIDKRKYPAIGDRDFNSFVCKGCKNGQVSFHNKSYP